MSAHGAAGSAMGTADRAGSSDALEHLARIGLVAYALVHLLVAWIAAQLAWGGGGSGKSADQSGAMATLANQPFGKPLLWVLAIGLIALAVWQGAEVLRLRSALSGSGRAKKKAIGKTVKAVAKTVVYLGLAFLALQFGTGGGKSSSQQQQQTTSGVFSWPGGRLIIGAVGLVLIGVGIYHVYKGVTKKFLEEIDLREAPATATRWITRLGQVGFPAKGVALGLVGGLLDYAAITYDPKKASGLDGAMRTILQAPFGAVLLTLTAAGIAAFGAYCIARARYLERT
jgi:hypothetical protein